MPLIRDSTISRSVFFPLSSYPKSAILHTLLLQSCFISSLFILSSVCLPAMWERWRPLGKYWDFQKGAQLWYLVSVCSLEGVTKENYVWRHLFKKKKNQSQTLKSVLKCLDTGSSWLRSIMSPRHLFLTGDLMLSPFHVFVDCSSLTSDGSPRHSSAPKYY